MAEGGKGNVDDGKSTDGKKEKQFNSTLSQLSVWKMSHDHHFQFGA